MNFRLTLGKIIGMVLVPVSIWILVFVYAYVTVRNLAYVPFPLIVSFFGLHDLNNLFSLGNIFIFAVEALIIYLILSLLQKGKIKILPQTTQPVAQTSTK